MVKISVCASAVALAIAKVSGNSVDRLKSDKQSANATRSQSRGLPGESANFAQYLRPYGCWCNFDQVSDRSMLNYGRGEPVDAWDALCKQLQQAYECAAIDAKERGEQCNPWEQDFSVEDWKAAETASKFTAGIDPYAWSASPVADVKQFGVTDPLWMCENIDDRCKTEVCIAEYWFLVSAWSLVLDAEPNFNQAVSNPQLIENYMTENNFHDRGFDKDANCPTKGNGKGLGPLEKACCGNWPRRYSYPIETRDGASRSCCNKEQQARDFNNNYYNVGAGSVFNPDLMKCCDDGALAALGQC